MTVYTDEEAQRQLAMVLKEARAQGEVRIRTGSGEEYLIRPAPTGKSPLDVGCVNLGISAEEIVNAVRESRERSR